MGSELKRKGWKYHALDYTFWSDAKPPVEPDNIYYQSLNNANAVIEIEKIIKRVKPDVVLTNSIVCPWAAIAAYYQNVPHVWFVREYGDLDHGREYMLGREKTYHDVDMLSDLVVANSKTLETHLAKYIDHKKISTLYNPFNIEEIIRLSKEKVENPFHKKGSLRLVLTGNLAPSKGQQEIIEIVGNLSTKERPIELCLIGRNNDDEYHKKLRKLVKKHNLDGNVHMIGLKKNPLPYVALADVGMMMSTQEAFGRVTFEYLALSKPVIGRNSGATPEMVEPGQNGFLFNETAQVADYIQAYIKNPELLEKHGTKSLAVAKDMMSGEHTALEIFKKIKPLTTKQKNNQYLFITKRWLEHPIISEEHIDYTHTMAFSKIFTFRFRRKLKHIYKKIKS